MTYEPMRSLREFHDTFAPDQTLNSIDEVIDRRMALIAEEHDEVMEALNHYDKTVRGFTSYAPEEALAELAGELADLLFVTYGTAEELCIPLEDVFQAVHKANMRKVWDDGTVHRNEYGKILKPPNFVKADIASVLYKA